MPTPKSQKEISILNQLRVLQAICQNNYISRAEIAKLTGLTSMTITNIVSRLIAEDIIMETPNIVVESTSGRKPIGLDITDNSPAVLGINISRRHIRLMVVDLKNNSLLQKKLPLDALDTKESFLSALADNCMEMISSVKRDIIAVGVASIGPIDVKSGTIIDPPKSFYLHDIPLVDHLKNVLNIPVYAINDASASALAEKTYGAGIGIDNLLLFRINYGVGSGIILGGILYDGINGMSGEIGHMSLNPDGPQCSCGSRGCVETYLNNSSFEDMINERYSFDPPLVWEDIVSLYNTKQKLFSKEFETYCSYISHAIINTVNMLDIHTVIMEYLGSENGDALEQEVSRQVNNMVLAKRIRKIQIVKSGIKETSSLLGATTFILKKIFSGEIAYR